MAKRRSVNTLNPIYDFAAKGQHAQQQDWHQAIEWYHKALTCLPNLYGTAKEIKPLSSDGPRPVAFTRQHAARIYAALGRCLMSMGHRQDSLMASRAAHQLDAFNHFACKSSDEISELQQNGPDESALYTQKTYERK